MINVSPVIMFCWQCNHFSWALLWPDQVHVAVSLNYRATRRPQHLGLFCKETRNHCGGLTHSSTAWTSYFLSQIQGFIYGDVWHYDCWKWGIQIGSIKPLTHSQRQGKQCAKNKKVLQNENRKTNCMCTWWLCSLLNNRTPSSVVEMCDNSIMKHFNFKGILHTKIKIMSLFIHPLVVSNQHDPPSWNTKTQNQKKKIMERTSTDISRHFFLSKKDGGKDKWSKDTSHQGWHTVKYLRRRGRLSMNDDSLITTSLWLVRIIKLYYLENYKIININSI